MPNLSRRVALGAALALTAAIVAADDPAIAELRAELEQLKTQYESRIEALERRLAEAERSAGTAAPAPNPSESQPMTAARVHSTPAATAPSQDGVLGAVGAANAFNPRISVILDGNYYHDGLEGEGSVLVGEAFQASRGFSVGHDHGSVHDPDHDHVEAEGDAAHAHAHGAADNGFNFREAELAFSATVDPYFDANLYLSIDGDGEVELEEGYFETRSLPYGLKVKGGKFLSGFGYANRKHPHEWDFVDQNLPYLNLLGDHGLQDTGLAVTWVPELPVYALFGVEVLQGDQELFGATLDDAERALYGLGDVRDGPRLWTAYAKVAPELPQNHALQLGASYAHNRQQQLLLADVLETGHDHDLQDEHEADHDETDEHADEHATEAHANGLDGDADLWGLDLVYTYDGDGPQGQGDFKFQTEYLRTIRDMTIQSSARSEAIGGGRTFTTDGLYAQATYGLIPRWKAGLRYDILGLTNRASGAGPSEDYGSSDRWTLDLTWDLSEFSRLRAQYSRNDILVIPGERERFDAFYLQFLMSLGSHGAHRF
jgi:hypothetical protein